MADTSYSPALGFVQLVAQRDAATLLPIIQNHVAPGTIIHSDQASMYNRVGSLPGVASHGTVNHSIEFVNSVQTVQILMRVYDGNTPHLQHADAIFPHHSLDDSNPVER